MNPSKVLFLCGLLFTLLLLPHPLSGYGEPDASGRPVYQERANHVFVNAVRIAPSQYKTVYMAGYSPSPASILTSYAAVAPVYLEPRLDASAYNHSLDMAVNNYFSHNSYDGTDPFTRIESFYTCNGNMGENIAAGYSDPLDTNNQWLCDSTGSACAADGSGSDGHRENIMNSVYKVIGVGYAYSSSSTYDYYWTQDFGGAACSPAPTTPIYGGSHHISGSNNKFIAVYYTTPATAPSSASVVVGGTSYSLTLDVGADGRGTYAATIAKGSACRSYYFTIGSYRYPDTGCLVTYGEGSCTTSFDATCGGSSTTATSSTAATTTTATSSTSTTKSASTTTSTTKSATSSTSTTKSATTSTTKSATTSTTKSATTSTTKSATSSTSTATTTTSTTGTTGTSSGYFLYSTSVQNGWTTYINPGGVLSTSATYSSQACLSVTLAATGSTNFFWFSHSPQVANAWTTLSFYAAGSSSTTLYIYFNGYYLQSKALTTSWQQFSISFSALGAPATLPELVFQNGGSSTFTLYLYNVQFA